MPEFTLDEQDPLIDCCRFCEGSGWWFDSAIAESIPCPFCPTPVERAAEIERELQDVKVGLASIVLRVLPHLE